MTRADHAARDWRTRLRDVFRFDSCGALLPVPAMALLLVGGILMGQRLTAAIAAGAAFSIGFGATKRLWHRRGYAMAVTSVGMTIVALLGTLAGNDPTVELAATIAMGFVSGGFVRYDTTLWWAWLQIVIAFLLAAHFPGSPLDALHRGLLVATGAALQCLLVPLAARIIGEASIIAGRDGARPTRREIALHAVRAGACIAVASLVAEAVGVAHGYWAPMTAMLVLKPGLRDTGWRGVERITGTIGGIALATGLLHILPPAPFLMAIVSVASAGLAFGLQRARYAVLSTAITASVLFMIALAGGAVIDADYDRLAATLIGGIVALAGASLAPRYPRWMRRNGDND